MAQKRPTTAQKRPTLIGQTEMNASALELFINNPARKCESSSTEPTVILDGNWTRCHVKGHTSINPFPNEIIQQAKEAANV